MFDDLGNRMKDYEQRTRYTLPRRCFSILRLDGKAFNSYTNKLDRPFDSGFILAMDQTALHLCEKIQGAQFAYVQSDEISILITDFDKPTTDAWFDNNIQKMTSISAAIASVSFVKLREKIAKDNRPAYFDSRVFTLSDPFEVFNYFLWRQQDATRNSITSTAQSLYSHKELFKKNTSEMQEMIFQRGTNWNDYPDRCKRGGLVVKETYTMTGATGDSCIRSHWVVKDIPVFTQDRKFLYNYIPRLDQLEDKDTV